MTLDQRVRRYFVWRETKIGCLVFGLLELALSASFFWTAIDTGSIFDYFIGGALLIGAVYDLTRFVLKARKDGRQQ